MEDIEVGTEVDLMESVQSGLQQNFGVQDASAAKKAKKESLQDMKKALPDWSLEPPETFLS